MKPSPDLIFPRWNEERRALVAQHSERLRKNAAVTATVWAKETADAIDAALKEIERLKEESESTSGPDLNFRFSRGTLRKLKAKEAEDVAGK